MTNNNYAAFIGLVLLLPFASALAIASLEIEPLHGFFSSTFTNDGRETNALGFFAQFLLLLSLPAALAIVVWPVFRRGADGQRQFHPVNLILGTAIAMVIVMFIGGVIVDQYPCWTGVPNCD